MSMNDHYDAMGTRLGRDIDAIPTSPRQQQRLHAIRTNALERVRPGRTGRLASLRAWCFSHPAAERRLAQSALALLVLCAGLALWQSHPSSYIDDEVDAQLLADEVPVDAWLSDQASALGGERS
ncbi:DUF3619 family protein [Chitinimonas sp. BJYL2]|uniref:DUF3619 family protein n=1 Tax=Chitinimonas sp. BJYL2 TaxID=2976696 RepID=UPI0022B2B6A5|nr:DUF3619 family protein [Chitinimonas sp. BJYL2]